MDEPPGDSLWPCALWWKVPVPAASPWGGIFVWRWDSLILGQRVDSFFFNPKLVKPVFHAAPAYAQGLAHLFDGLAQVVICKIFVLLGCPIVSF
jgi:hypothetical protein